MNTTIKWTAAIVLSLLAHAGAAKLFEPDEKPTELDLVQGGDVMEIAVLGNAFTEMLQAGDPAEALEPQEIEPREFELLPAEVAEVAPLPSDVMAEMPTDILPTEADVILPVEDMPPVAAEQPEMTATVAPAETVIPDEKPEPQEILKPEPEKKPESKEKPEKEKPKKKVVRKQSGDAGKQQESVSKGQADGVDGAVAPSASSEKGKKSQALGNAAETRYAGRVRSRVQRNFRYPKSAVRGMKGTVTVGFTVIAGGALGNARMVRGSGSPVLDEAALNAVRKAVPFPAIPEGGRSPWPFTIELVYK